MVPNLKGHAIVLRCPSGPDFDFELRLLRGVGSNLKSDPADLERFFNIGPSFTFSSRVLATKTNHIGEQIWD